MLKSRGSKAFSITDGAGVGSIGGHEDARRAGEPLLQIKAERVEFRLEKRRLWGNLTVAFQYLKGSHKKDGEGLYQGVW